MISANESGPRKGQLDRERWNAKYRQHAGADLPCASLLGIESYLPTRGTALDVAGGAGRHAVWLAQRGLAVTLADVSEVGLVLARQRARQAGVTIRTQQVDLCEEHLPAGRWSLILCCLYLHRPLFGVFPQLLQPEGVLVVIQPTLKNLERNERPPQEYLVAEGELPSLVPQLEIVHHQETWSPEDRHEAVLVARAPSAPIGMTCMPNA